MLQFHLFIFLLFLFFFLLYSHQHLIVEKTHMFLLIISQNFQSKVILKCIDLLNKRALPKLALDLRIVSHPIQEATMVVDSKKWISNVLKCDLS